MIKPEEWLEELAQGLEFRRKYGVEDKWHELESYFYNIHPALERGGPNLIMSTGDALLSSLTVPRPHVRPEPLKPELVEAAPLLGKVDNMLLEQIDASTQMQDATIYAFLYGKGFLKVGYDSKYGFNPELDITDLGMTLSQFDKKGRKIEFGDNQPGYPWVSSVLPHDIVVPWGTRDLDSSEWVAHRVVRHIDDVKADSKYRNTSNLSPNISIEEFQRSYSRPLQVHRMGKDIKLSRKTEFRKPEYVELWEIHDKRTGKIYVIVPGHDKFLRNENDVLQLDGLPFIEIGFTPRSRSIWVTPDSYYLLAHQAELADITIQASKQRRISTAKFLYGEDAIEESELQNVTSSDVGVGIKVNGGHNLNEAVKSLQMGNNILLHQDAEFIRRDARETVGFSRNQLGEYQGGRQTATEASIVEEKSQQRLSRRMLEVRRAYIDMVRKVNAMIFQFWRLPQVIQVAGNTGAAKWFRFTGPGLRGPYNYKIDFTSDPVPSEQQRKQEAFQIYLAMSQDPTVDPIALRKYLIRAYSDVEFSSIFLPEIQNASLPLQVSQVQQGAGARPSNGGQQQGGQVSGVQQGNGTRSGQRTPAG